MQGANIDEEREHAASALAVTLIQRVHLKWKKVCNLLGPFNSCIRHYEL